MANEAEQEAESLDTAKERLSVKTVNYAQAQIKWLKKRIAPIFAADRLDRRNLLHRIVLDDPREYEAIAVAQGVAFVQEMVEFYRS